MADKAGSFGAFTVAQRFPKIVAEVIADFPSDAAGESQWKELIDAVTRNGEIDTSLLTPTTGYMANVIGGLSGKTWHELPFFDLEFLFYHAINSIADQHIPGHDVFAAQKEKALMQAIKSLVLPDGPISLKGAINASLYSNVADFSQLHGFEGRDASTLIVDDRAKLLDHLSCPGSGPIHLIADNAGPELVADLILVAALLSTGWTVQLHIKPWPMFVSDATKSDVDLTMQAFASSPNAALQRIHTVLRSSRDEKLFSVEAPADWGEPRHMNNLSQPLLDRLCEGHGVLLKGDLNYRRAFGDLAWPADTDAMTAFLVPEMPAFALRVLKSELAIGTPRERLADLEREIGDWRTSGEFAVAQFIGRTWTP